MAAAAHWIVNDKVHAMSQRDGQNGNGQSNGEDAPSTHVGAQDQKSTLTDIWKNQTNGTLSCAKLNDAGVATMTQIDEKLGEIDATWDIGKIRALFDSPEYNEQLKAAYTTWADEYYTSPGFVAKRKAEYASYNEEYLKSWKTDFEGKMDVLRLDFDDMAKYHFQNQARDAERDEEREELPKESAYAEQSEGTIVQEDNSCFVIDVAERVHAMKGALKAVKDAKVMMQKEQAELKEKGEEKDVQLEKKLNIVTAMEDVLTWLRGSNAGETFHLAALRAALGQWSYEIENWTTVRKEGGGKKENASKRSTSHTLWGTLGMPHT